MHTACATIGSMRTETRHIESAPIAHERAKRFIATAAALTMLLFSSWSLNCNLFPLYASHVFVLREICTLTNGAALVALAFISISRPNAIKPAIFFLLSLFCAVLGGALVWGGNAADSTVALVAGACITSVAEGACTIIVMLAIVSLESRAAMACIIVGELASIALRPLCPIGYSDEMLLIHIALTLGAALLSALPAKNVVESMRDDTPARDLAITQPASFLPFGHQLFICLFLFRILYGLMLTFGESGGAPVHSSVDFIPPLILLIILATRRRITADGLFKAAILFAVAGLLLMPASGIVSFAAIQGFLSLAVVIFEVFNVVVLVSLSRRNVHNALAVFSWGWALNSIGVVLGANMGRAINASWTENLSFSVLATAVLTFCFVAYVILFLQGFNFEKTISEVEEPSPVIPLAIEEPAVKSIDLCCDELSDECGLTKREREVLGLLARGRSGVFIQNELVVSYNTVKSHVKHIYMKTGAHTHQELIDLVEAHRHQDADERSAS